jgi:hypothetical protein
MHSAMNSIMDVGRNSQAQQKPTQRRGRIATRHTSHPPRITIKGHLTGTPIRAQEADHRFHRGMTRENLSGLGPQSDRAARIQKVAHLDHMLTLALRALLGRDGADIFKSTWISSNGLRSSLSWGGSLERVTRQPVVCRIIQMVRLERGRRSCAVCNSSVVESVTT